LVYPQENSVSGTIASSPISSQLKQFSPLGEIIVRNLGMNDRNGNGVIDECRDDKCGCKDEDNCEGFNEFINRYGIGETYAEKRASIDRGFHANGVIVGANNGKLEENEIVNHYYMNIRFKEVEITDRIDPELTAYIYANSIPLVWLDDEQGTVMSAVTRVLGEGWNNPAVERTEDEAVRMFTRVMQGMRITGRTGDPGRTGYYTLPEMVNRRTGYCFEVAQLGFWFFSELKINSVLSSAFLTPSISHIVIALPESQRRIDYFGSSARYRTSPDSWHVKNPIQSVSAYYSALGHSKRSSESVIPLLEQALIYDKYDLSNIVFLMDAYERGSAGKSDEIIALGEFFLNSLEPDNFDASVNKILQTVRLDRASIARNLENLLCLLLICYSNTNNRPKFENIRIVAEKHFSNSRHIQEHIRYYSRLLN